MEAERLSGGRTGLEFQAAVGIPLIYRRQTVTENDVIASSLDRVPERITHKRKKGDFHDRPLPPRLAQDRCRGLRASRWSFLRPCTVHGSHAAQMGRNLRRRRDRLGLCRPRRRDRGAPRGRKRVRVGKKAFTAATRPSTGASWAYPERRCRKGRATKTLPNSWRKT